MKKSFVIASVLLTAALFAQEKKDSTQTNNLDEVIINPFIKKDTESTNKMPLSFIENSQIYTSIDKSVLEQQTLFTVDDAYRNVTGLQRMWSPTGRAGDGGSFVTVRGFTSNFSLRNGLVGPVSTSMDAVNIEKVEVLKGPSATLFGSNYSSYGAVVNRVTKKPHEKFEGSITAAGGSYNYYRVQADVNAPLTKDNKLLFRLNTAYTNAGTFQKTNAQNTYHAFTPSLTYKPTKWLDINVEFEMFDNNSLVEQSFFGVGGVEEITGINNIKTLYKAYNLDYKESYIGDNVKVNSIVRNLYGQVNIKINKNIKSSTNVSSTYSFSDGYGAYFSFVGANQELSLLRGIQGSDHNRQKNFQIQQNFNFDYRFGNSMRNRTLVGFDFSKQKTRLNYLSLAPFDINPNSSVPLKGYDYSDMNKSSIDERYRNGDGLSSYIDYRDLNIYSAYISNVFTPMKGLNIMASVRVEHNDSKESALWTIDNDTDPYKNTFWSPKFGLVYEIINNKFSVFGNYQNSFKNLGYYANIQRETVLAKPEQANQIEAGLKTNIWGGRINATLSYYNINVENSLRSYRDLTTIPVFDYSTQEGTLKSEGVELEINTYLVKGFSLIAGVSYNDTKFTNAPANIQGLRPDTSGSPWAVNFNASYQFFDGAIKGLGFGIGGNYADNNKIVNTTAGHFILPEYFVLNANAFYDAKKFRISAKVDNLTNQKYWIGYATANPQQLVNATASLTYKF